MQDLELVHGSAMDIVVDALRRAGCEPKRKKNGYTSRCPCHVDRVPSFSIKPAEGGMVQPVCFACHASYTEIGHALNLDPTKYFGKPPQKVVKLKEHENLSVSLLAAKKGLPETELRTLGLKDISGGVQITYFDFDGNVEGIRQRSRRHSKAKLGSTWLGSETDRIIPYGRWRLPPSTEAENFDLIVDEGESDCWTLWHYDYVALGLPGSGTAQKLEIDDIRGFRRIFVIVEPDAAGKSFGKSVTARCKELGFTNDVLLVKMPSEPKDPNALHFNPETGINAKFKEQFDELLAAAKPYEEEKEDPDTDDDVLSYLYRKQNGDADLFAKLVKDSFRYDHTDKAWYFFENHSWRQDITRRYRGETARVRAVYEKKREEVAGHSEKQEEALHIRIQALDTLKHQNAVCELAADAGRGLAMAGTEWDDDPWLFAVANGVINLRDGSFRDGRPEDFMRMQSEVEYKGHNEPCPSWLKVVYEICGENQAVTDYLQTFLGYCLTGLSTDKIWPVLYGKDGDNGKSMLMEIMYRIMGNYATAIPGAFLMESKNDKDPNGPSPVEMMLYKRRLAWASETRAGGRLNVNKMKLLTGNDTMTGRAPYGTRELTWTPTHKLVLLTNHAPKIDASDSAAWSRIRLINLPLSFRAPDQFDPSNPLHRPQDAYLKERLKPEYPGILGWLLRGTARWIEKGLDAPKEILDMTRMYRQEEDSIGRYMKECLEPVGSHDILAPDPAMNYRIRAGVLWDNYVKWAEGTGAKVDGKVRFGIAIKEAYKVHRDRDGIEYIGIRFKED